MSESSVPERGSAVLTIVIGLGLLQVGSSSGNVPIGCQANPAKPTAAENQQVRVKSNNQCYVCHMLFVREGLATMHAKAPHVWCGTCHGPSVRHIEDENIGATPPDIVFKKGKVNRMCGQCHDPEEHSPLTAKTRRARLAEGEKAQREIKRRKLKVTGVCTDCHGRHWEPSRKRTNSKDEKSALDRPT